VKNRLSILVGKLEEKRPLEKPRHKCEDNIKACVYISPEAECDDVD
jgi:hypothetical protein